MDSFFDAHTPYLGHAGFSAPHPYQQEILYVDHLSGSSMNF
jgi:hypothetical protein